MRTLRDSIIEMIRKTEEQLEELETIEYREMNGVTTCRYTYKPEAMDVLLDFLCNIRQEVD